MRRKGSVSVMRREGQCECVRRDVSVMRGKGRCECVRRDVSVMRGGRADVNVMALQSRTIDVHVQ